MSETNLPECERHPGAMLRQQFERSAHRCYEYELTERCVLCGRPVATYGVLWEIAPQPEPDDGA